MPPAFALSQDQTLQLSIVVHPRKFSFHQTYGGVGLQSWFDLVFSSYTNVLLLRSLNGLSSQTESCRKFEMTACKGGGFGGYDPAHLCERQTRPSQPCGCCPNCSLVKDLPRTSTLTSQPKFSLPRELLAASNREIRSRHHSLLNSDEQRSLHESNTLSSRCGHC